MAEISDVRDLLFAHLEAFASQQSPTLRIVVPGRKFTPDKDETFLRFALRVAEPSKPYAGTTYISQEKGFFQVDIMGPEKRLQRTFEKLAWAVREHYWPTVSLIAPTYGTDPLVRLGPTAPQVIDHPAPDDGRLGSIVTINWFSDFRRP